MRRRTFDTLVSSVGLLLTVVLIVAGALLMWGYTFTNDQVNQQLSAQQIHFPPANSPAVTQLPASDATAMKKYAGQLMTNGAQAETYANHFIAVHLSEVAGGQSYAQVSSKLQPPAVNSLSPVQVIKLKAQAGELFQGTTLRGMLLNAYAFWQIGQIALIAAIVSFIAAAIMLILSVLGFWHVRRTPSDAVV
ncbi:MAG: hypothetical protein ACYCPF_20760 [Streptosporangiaceae bacterium]